MDLWPCDRCTLLNEQIATKCDTCGAKRPPVRVALSGQLLTERIEALKREKQRQAALERRANLLVAAQAAEEQKAIERAVIEAERREVGNFEEQCNSKEFLEDQSCDYEEPSYVTTASTMSQSSTWKEYDSEWANIPPSAPVPKPDKRHGIGTLKRPMPPVVHNKVGICPRCRADLRPSQQFCGCGDSVKHITCPAPTQKVMAWAPCKPDASAWRSIHDSTGPPGYTAAEREAERPTVEVQSTSHSEQTDEDVEEGLASDQSSASAELFPASPSPRMRQPEPPAPAVRTRSSSDDRSNLSLGDLWRFFGGAVVIILVGLPQSGKTFLADALEKYADFTVIRRSHEAESREFYQMVESECKRAADATTKRLRYTQTRFVIDAENLRERDRQALWNTFVVRFKVNPMLVRFLVLVPTRKNCHLSIKRLMKADRLSREEAENLVRACVATFNPLNTDHLTSSSSILTLFNRTESEIVRSFVKYRLVDFYDDAILSSHKAVSSRDS